MNSKRGPKPEFKAYDHIVDMMLMRLEGCDNREIAKRYGITRQYVSQLFARASSEGYEVPRAPSNSYRRGKNVGAYNHILDILIMREDGATYQEIGDVYGITRERVRQLLFKAKEQGIDVPPSRNHAYAKRKERIASRDASILELYDIGKNVDEISQSFELTPSQVRKVLRTAGYHLAKQRTKSNTEKKCGSLALNDVRDRFLSGESAKSIASSAGVSIGRVYQALHLTGIRSHPERGVDQNVYILAAELHRRGMSIPGIAEITGRSRETIYRWFSIIGYDVAQGDYREEAYHVITEQGDSPYGEDESCS